MADVVGALVLSSLTLATVGLALAAAQPSRAHVVWCAVALGLLPAGVLLALLVAWLLGR